MKRIISLLLVICLMSSFCVTGASASEIAGNAEATVRYIDENGDIHSSDKSIDFF